jgi:hypothetical protein
MKRYDLVIQYEDGHIHEVIGEDATGRYHLVSDVERAMIPRPSEVEARKAVSKALNACERWAVGQGTEQEVDEAEAYILRLLGVDVK